jgi:hypothetical protein
MAAPIPRELPVTKATLPASFCVLLVLIFLLRFYFVIRLRDNTP